LSDDIHVFKIEEVGQSAIKSLYFEGGITHYTREPDVEGEGTWIVLHHANGGRTCILTNRPLVLAEPERH